MCSIYGSFNSTMNEILYDANKARGLFASSFICILNDKTIQCIQQEGHPRNMDELKPGPTDVIYLGHNQAPTSAKHGYSKATSHPFQYKNWMVAHNGVLTNWKELNMQYTPYNKNPVDTSVIPAMLAAYKAENPDISNKTIIRTILNRLEGTFALWILDTTDPYNVYLARQGSTLFANKTGSFSSIQGNGWEELQEGKIYLMANNTITEVENFTNKTPFLVI